MKSLPGFRKINMASINGVRAPSARHRLLRRQGRRHSPHPMCRRRAWRKGIRVNCISPGLIATGIFAKGAGLDHDAADLTAEAAKAAFAEILPRWQPLSRMGSAADIAQASLFLASEASGLLNGHNMIVDGGIIAGWPASVSRVDLQNFATKFKAALE
jgi:hypothetical protein